MPLIIGGGSDRAIVASCSSEAIKQGVRPGMPMRYALQLCPQAKVVRGDMELFSRYSHLVAEIIQEQAPVVERSGIDEFYLDISGMDKFFGCFKWTNELVKKINHETGLPLSFGLSPNKTVSKIATGEAKPTGRIQILPLEVQPFLDPLPVSKIPLVGEKTYSILSRIGIRKIQVLSQTPVDLLEELLGENGREIWKRSNGIDTTPVEPETEKRSVSNELTFDNDTIDIGRIKNLLTAMIEKLAFELRSGEWLTSTIIVKIKYNNLDTHTKQGRITYTSCDDHIRPKVMELFDKLYDRRMRIRLVGLRFGGLVRGSYQINLFEDTTENVALYQAIDRMKKRFGFHSVVKAAGLDAMK
jgi:DNA polymerase IV